MASRKGQKSICSAASGPSYGPACPHAHSRSPAVLSLGRIEFLHPGFHDVKNLWPVGYCAARLAATPASGKKETVHVCQILEAPDGAGPLFRWAPAVCLNVHSSHVSTQVS